MIGIYMEKETETRALIMGKHYRPEEIPPVSKDPNKYMEVATVPVFEEKPYKELKEYINPQTGEIWVEYTDRPLTDQEKIIELTKQIADHNLAMAAIMGGAV